MCVSRCLINAFCSAVLRTGAVVWLAGGRWWCSVAVAISVRSMLLRGRSCDKPIRRSLCGGMVGKATLLCGCCIGGLRAQRNQLLPCSPAVSFASLPCPSFPFPSLSLPFVYFLYLIGFTTEASWPCLHDTQNPCQSGTHGQHSTRMSIEPLLRKEN